MLPISAFNMCRHDDNGTIYYVNYTKILKEVLTLINHISYHILFFIISLIHCVKTECLHIHFKPWFMIIAWDSYQTLTV